MSILRVVRDPFVELMTEEFLVAQRLSCELFLQKRAHLERIAFFGLGRRQIGQRRLEFSQFFAAQLSIEPGSPFFFKRFHKRPSGNSVTFCGHKTVATSPCRWSNPGFRRFRDTAFLRFLSLKLLRGVRVRVGKWRGRSWRESRVVPCAGGGAGRLLARSSKRDRFLSTE